MTLQELITNRIRGLVNDTLASPLQKCADAVYLVWVQDFFRQLYADVQEAFMDANGGIPTFAPDALTLSTAWPVESMYVTPCLDFVAVKFFTSDSAGTRNDTKAAEHQKNYDRWFSPKG